MSYLLDTNVVSEWAKPRPEPRVIAWLADVDEDRVFLSVVTFAELHRGIELLPPGRKKDRLSVWADADLFERFEGRVLDVTPPVARSWGAVMAHSQTAGRALGTMDAFFAATALVHDLTLVTRNDADFSAAGIEVFNPWRGA